MEETATIIFSSPSIYYQNRKRVRSKNYAFLLTPSFMGLRNFNYPSVHSEHQVKMEVHILALFAFIVNVFCVYSFNGTNIPIYVRNILNQLNSQDKNSIHDVAIIELPNIFDPSVISEIFRCIPEENPVLIPNQEVKFNDQRIHRASVIIIISDVISVVCH